MIKCRQRAGGEGAGRNGGEREAEGERKRGFNFFSSLTQWHASIFPVPVIWDPTFLNQHGAPGLPRLPFPLPTSTLCQGCDTSDLPLPPAGQQKQAASTKNSCRTIACLHKNPARAQRSGFVLRDCQTPTLAQSGGTTAGASPRCHPEPSWLPSHPGPTISRAPGSPACFSLPSL